MDAGRPGLRDGPAITAATLLAAAAVGSRLRDDPLNAGFLAVCIGVAALAGWVVGYNRRRRAAAGRQARARQADLDAARDEALRPSGSPSPGSCTTWSPTPSA